MPTTIENDIEKATDALLSAKAKAQEAGLRDVVATLETQVKLLTDPAYPLVVVAHRAKRLIDDLIYGHGNALQKNGNALYVDLCHLRDDLDVTAQDYEIKVRGG
jgi:hypothetical protein